MHTLGKTVLHALYTNLIKGSMDSQLDAMSLSGTRLNQWQDRKSSLTRSQTDSNITYAGDDIPEAPGSFYYITRDGNIDHQVVLKVSFIDNKHKGPYLIISF